MTGAREQVTEGGEGKRKGKKVGYTRRGKAEKRGGAGYMCYITISCQK
jgi:hypothetical protein